MEDATETTDEVAEPEDEEPTHFVENFAYGLIQGMTA
jgi:hypothetical protein